MEFPSWIGGSYQSQSFTADQEDTWNWYLEKMEVRGPTSKGTLYPTPGVTLLSTGTYGTPGGAHFANAGREFAVIGTHFVEILIDATFTDWGTVARDSNPATLCCNGAGDILITSGGNGYNFDTVANVFTTVAFLNQKAAMGVTIDGYFLALDINSTTHTNPTVYISALFDGTSWDATKFFQRSAGVDPWVSMVVTSRYIYMLGERTTEIWYDVGTSPVPFAPYPSGQIAYGCAAPFSTAVVDGTLMWLAQTEGGAGAVVRAGGTSPEIISTYPVQFAISNYTSISDAVADTYSEVGHSFYLLYFPTGDITWAYDAQSQVWHKRGTWSTTDGSFHMWRPRYHAYIFGQHRMLDSQTGAVYQMSIDIATDVDGGPIRRVRRSPALVQDNERIVYSAFELDLDRGQGLVTGQGSDPQVMLRMSNDGGATWGNELQMSAGKIGQYKIRAKRNRCGQARRKVFEVSVSDPIPWRLTNAYLRVGDPSQQGAQQPQGQQQGAA